MQLVTAIIQPLMLEHVCDALRQIDGLPGITVSDVLGWGMAKAANAPNSVQKGGCVLARMAKIEALVTDSLAPAVVDAIEAAARTGNVGDGKTFILDLREVVKIRTGERGVSAA